MCVCMYTRLSILGRAWSPSSTTRFASRRGAVGASSSLEITWARPDMHKTT